MLRRCWYLMWVLLPLWATAQTDDVFTVKKPEGAVAMPESERDTFMRQVFASANEEMHNRIKYVTAIQILDENTLIVFKATRSILDTLKWFSDKNANTGEWHKVNYELREDTLYFTYDEIKRRAGNDSRTVKVTHSFIAAVHEGKLSITEVTSSDADAQVRPRVETSDYALVNETPVIRRRD